MKKIALAVATAAAALTTVSVGTVPAKAETFQVAQAVDVQVGRDRDDRVIRREHREPGVSVGIGERGLRVGPREHCRTVVTHIERGGRSITQRERRCD
jgi:hypothetical protein